MTNPKRTLIAALLDRTGSMEDIKHDVTGAFDAFIGGQRDADLGDDVYVSLYQFDTIDPREVVYERRPLADVPKLTLEPRAGTPLHDALGATIIRVDEELAALPEDDRPGRVYFVVMTDGEENSSREWTLERVRELVERQTNQWHWEFHFLGVGIDAFRDAASYGVSRLNTNSATRDSASIRQNYGAMGQSIVTSRSQDR